MEIKVQEFLDYARTRSGEYEYVSNKDCAIAQFLKSKGHRDVCVGPDAFSVDGPSGEYHTIPKELRRVLIGPMSGATWEGLVRRAEAAGLY